MAVKRYWAKREEDFLTDQEFLLDPQPRGDFLPNPNAKTLEDWSGTSCVVALGEPGSGKSTVFKAAASLDADSVLLDLRLFRTDDSISRQVFEGPVISAWLNGPDGACLYLDSFDEARSSVPHLTMLFERYLREWNLGNRRLRLACRTADWPESLLKTLKATFKSADTGAESVEVLELLPLTKSDIGEVATKILDPKVFLNEVHRTGVGALAARPLTLLMLADQFVRTGSLPIEAVDLYQQGVIALCTESESRREAGAVVEFSPESKVAIASRVAACTLFGGTGAIWDGSGIEPDGPLRVKSLAGGTEPTYVGPISVDEASANAALSSGLFTSGGPKTYRWAHQTFADYLAAHWIHANGIARDRCQTLFMDSDKRCWPQTRLCAAWLVAIDPQKYGWLATEDPESFRGEVGLPVSLRGQVVDGLVKNAARLPRWDSDYRMLAHPELSTQIGPLLRHSNKAVRELALDIAFHCRSGDLMEDLVAICLDPAAQQNERQIAAMTVCELRLANPTASLRPLALDSSLRESDFSGALLGLALEASWPHALTSLEVLTSLVAGPPKDAPGYSLTRFTTEFCASYKPEDLTVGLDWLLDLDPSIELFRPVDDVANAIVALGVSNLDQPGVKERIANLIKRRLRHYRGLVFGEHDYRWTLRNKGKVIDPLGDPTRRKAILTQLIQGNPTRDSDLALGVGGVSNENFLRPDDLRWLLDDYSNGPSKSRAPILWMIEILLQSFRPEDCELILGLPSEHTFMVDAGNKLIAPVDLDSEVAVLGRERTRHRQELLVSSRRAVAQPVDEHLLFEENLEHLLFSCEFGAPREFWRIPVLFAETSVSWAEWDPDLTNLGSWKSLSRLMQSRILVAADSYLLLSMNDRDPWLTKPPGFALAGYQALVLLMRDHPDRLGRLSAEVWKVWAPTLATAPSLEGSSWETKRQLLTCARALIPEELEVAFCKHADAVATTGSSFLTHDEIRFFWGRKLETTLTRLIDSTTSDATRRQFVNAIRTYNFRAILPTLRNWLALTDDAGRSHLAAEVLFELDLENSWDELRTIFEADQTVAERVIGHVGGRWRSPEEPLGKRAGELSGDLPSEIYAWLHSHFPPDTDPVHSGAYAPSDRDEVRDCRNQILSDLVADASEESVAQLKKIQTRFSAIPWIEATLAQAEEGFRAKIWEPTSPKQLIELATYQDRRLIRSHADLLEVVLRALDSIQSRLTGRNPESHLLWNTSPMMKPKSEDEVSNYLVSELRKELSTSGLLINREVEIRRNGPGIGERTDLLVEASSLDRNVTSTLSLPVEVKGAWSDELLTSLDEQLAARYMADLGAPAGAYIAIWPDLGKWDKADRRKSSVTKLVRVDVEQELKAQAEKQTENGRRIAVVNLDIAYSRLNPVPVPQSFEAET